MLISKFINLAAAILTIIPISLKARLTLDDYYQGTIQHDRIILAKAITLIESNLPEDQLLAEQLMEKILSRTGNAIRIGITGVPGVGKSTFIEVFGNYITSLKKKLAVLTIDPSSQITKGSILGDKTRMEDLSKNPLAFIRPSSAGDALGGVANKTRETVMLCEAAGFDVILIETVGVGQSEIAVKNMVDFFLLLMLAGAGDELQGMKKGIIEMADAIAITKADGDNIRNTLEAQAEYQHALHLLPPSLTSWEPKVLTCSAVTKEGIDAVWKMIEQFEHTTKQSGHFFRNREQQHVVWLNEFFDYLIRLDFQRNPGLKREIELLEEKVRKKEMAVNVAARQLLTAYHHAIRGSNS